eukprot:TRINITY_DN9983_c1_g1_i1.p1 TRINITY_DN9983_c1_g1~~TRINITY_DN9983_c1_g1_i1.p1  ORF type:complete len:317 (-),score=34.91 TRINITY_DN9983_c1_g1_i1:85-921(-)
MVATLPEIVFALEGPKSSLVHSLYARELGSLQLANRATKVALDDSNIWEACVRRELPQLVVSPMLFDGPERRSVLHCLAYLDRAILALNCVVNVDSAEDVRQLEGTLRSARSSADAHRAGGGNVAHVLVGSFGVAEEDSPCSFAFGTHGRPPLGTFAPGRLHVKIKCNGTDLRVGARYSTFARAAQAGASARDGTPFSLDLRSCGTTGARLSCRGCPLRTDGLLRRATFGMCELKGQVVQPVVCVLTLTDGEPELQMPLVAPTLHLQLASRNRDFGRS